MQREKKGLLVGEKHSMKILALRSMIALANPVSPPSMNWPGFLNSETSVCVLTGMLDKGLRTRLTYLHCRGTVVLTGRTPYSRPCAQKFPETQAHICLFFYAIEFVPASIHLLVWNSGVLLYEKVLAGNLQVCLG